MAINFPDNPSDGDIATVGGVTYTYTASSNTWKPPVPGASTSTLTDLGISDGTAGQLLTTDGNNNFSFTSITSASSTEIFADMAALIAKTGMSAGDQGLVLENNKLFMYTGSAWYLIATMVNNSPTAITNVDSAYALAIDGTPTVITAVSTDPDGFPLTWSYAITSGSLGSTATISQTDNVFTITPSTNSVDAGEFSITFSATDGGSSGIVNKSTSISLAFSVINSKYTTLLATATDTSDNNNIIDSSTNNHSVSVNGDVYAGTFSPYRSGGYSTYFDGSGGDYVKSATHSDFGFSTDDFTIECWYYPVSRAQPYPRVWNFGPYWQDSSSLAFLDRHNDKPTTFALNSFSGGEILNSTTTVEDNTWYHLTVERSGPTITLYVNGVAEDTYNIGTSQFITSSDSYVTIGNVGDGSPQNLTEAAANGYIRDFRYVKGTAVYTANFTPPNERLEAITNTSLLTCHLPYISDGSINNHTITSNGNVTTQPISPYDYSKYVPNVHGGSVYFDGSGDYVSIASNPAFGFGTGDFTIEFWTYWGGTLNTVNGGVFVELRSAIAAQATVVYVSTSGEIHFYDGPANVEVGSGVTITQEWTHIALTRESGLWRIFVNGTLGTTRNSSTDLGSSQPCQIGQGLNGTTTSYHGYIQDVRITPALARYTANFTPPTSPLSSSGSSLHIKGTDASIIDKSQSSNLKVFGNTTGSTTQVKFTDSKSMYFDGTAGYVRVEDLDMRGDLTMECWFYQTAAFDSSTYRALFSASTYSFTAPLAMYSFNGSIHTYLNHTNQLIGGTITQNTWHHVALVRSSGTWTQYVDGVSVATSTINGTYNFAETTDWNIGVGVGYNYPFTGYVQDFRMTKGLARYTANFVPPIESLKG